VGLPACLSQIDTSGPPCQDWSSSGKRLESQGPRFLAFLAWAFWHLRVQTPLIIFEDVVGFDAELLRDCMGTSYHIFVRVMAPADVGWGCCKRPRIYAALVNRQKLRLLADPNVVFENVSARLRRGFDLRLRDLLVAPGASACPPAGHPTFLTHCRPAHRHDRSAHCARSAAVVRLSNFMG
jgi:hypothetical protein